MHATVPVLHQTTQLFPPAFQNSSIGILNSGIHTTLSSILQSLFLVLSPSWHSPTHSSLSALLHYSSCRSRPPHLVSSRRFLQAPKKSPALSSSAKTPPETCTPSSHVANFSRASIPKTSFAPLLLPPRQGQLSSILSLSDLLLSFPRPRQPPRKIFPSRYSLPTSSFCTLQGRLSLRPVNLQPTNPHPNSNSLANLHIPVAAFTSSPSHNCANRKITSPSSCSSKDLSNLPYSISKTDDERW